MNNHVIFAAAGYGKTYSLCSKAKEAINNGKIGFIHNCDMFNYGGSKGATYERVVIIPVSTTLPFIEKQIKISSNQTRAKFYVACTRAKHSIVFAINKPKVNALFKSVEINISGITLPALKYIHQ